MGSGKIVIICDSTPLVINSLALTPNSPKTIFNGNLRIIADKGFKILVYNDSIYRSKRSFFRLLSEKLSV